MNIKTASVYLQIAVSVITIVFIGYQLYRMLKEDKKAKTTPA